MACLLQDRQLVCVAKRLDGLRHLDDPKAPLVTNASHANDNGNGPGSFYGSSKALSGRPRQNFLTLRTFSVR